MPLFRDEVAPAYLAQLANHARQNDGDILVGMVEAPSGRNEYYNSMFSFGTPPIRVIANITSFHSVNSSR